MDIAETSQEPQICSLSGRFTFKDNDAFLQAIRDFVGRPAKHLVLDLSQLEFIDSFALGLFLVATEMAEAADKTVTVRNPQGPVRRLFRLSRLEQVLRVEDTIESAPMPTAAPPQNLRQDLQISGLIELEPGVMSVELSGRFTFADHAAFQHLMDCVKPEAIRDLHVGLSGLDFMDSAGLSMLLVIRDELEARNGKLVLVSPRGKVMQLLRLSSVDTVVSIIDAPKTA
ncbi:MAG: STAS domain-containing protein [Alphaproteobacteria bacterium]|nr:STAS domain-containing protein [Alphaproteobacteria bacterium]